MFRSCQLWNKPLDARSVSEALLPLPTDPSGLFSPAALLCSCARRGSCPLSHKIYIQKEESYCSLTLCPCSQPGSRGGDSPAPTALQPLGAAWGRTAAPALAQTVPAPSGLPRLLQRTPEGSPEHLPSSNLHSCLSA